jgi:hypothetical protein
MSHALTTALRARGIEVLTALEASMIARPDDEHLDFATTEGRVLLSYNVGDYFELHTARLQKNEHHAGIIVCQQTQYSIGEQLKRLLKLIATLSEDEMQDRIEFLSAWSGES